MKLSSSRMIRTVLVLSSLAATHTACAQSQPVAALPVHGLVGLPMPLPLPGQLKPLPRATPPGPAGRSHPSDPQARVGAANRAARVQPDGQGFVNAIQQYPYAQGALYQVYTAPGRVTDIALQEGETLAGAGPVAAGDTVRWLIGDTISGTGNAAQVHILVKPTRDDIATNLVINTNRRTYYLEIQATAGAYMASVSWLYPLDQLVALRGERDVQAAATPVAAGLSLDALNFAYTITGDKVAWKPRTVFDDGRQVYIEFSEAIATGEMPPLFVTDAKGTAELVNYRVSGRYMIVDRLFVAAELRLGTSGAQRRVSLRAQGRRDQR